MRAAAVRDIIGSMNLRGKLEPDQPMPSRRSETPPPSPVPMHDAAPIEPDDVDDASLWSFPASDPPSWSTLRIGPPRQP
jgi:hypothetical protein